MLLVDHQIREEIKQGRIKISPFRDDLINPSSMDVRLGGNFGSIEATEVIVDPTNSLSFTTKMLDTDWHILKPKEFIIASLLEDITLPKDVSVRVVGKSSLGRLGIENSSCAGHVDPGWSGVLTIELYNYSNQPIRLSKGMKIGQLLFYKHPPCEVGYGEKSTSKYQNQEPGQGSKGV